MTRIFRYILQHDTGMAPCIDRGLLSLATCKPKIRAGARVGEWVIGFRPSPAPRGLVVWAGRVAQSLEVGDYERKYRGRSDAVYRAKVGGGYNRLQPVLAWLPVASAIVVLVLGVVLLWQAATAIGL